LKACALIVFARDPQPGKVKTRLASDIGDETSCRVYRQLLKKTLCTCRTVSADFHVFLVENPQTDFFSKLPFQSEFSLRVQKKGHLGEKMEAAFSWALEKYRKVVLVGSDCPGLTREHLLEAFHLLGDRQVVLGSAEDGGYYLVGQSSPTPGLFEDIDWSSDRVLEQSLENLEKSQVDYALLTELYDIDEEKDLLRYLAEEALNLESFLRSEALS
jgi:rSAM/selenodomain-associated transferase 1